MSPRLAMMAAIEANNAATIAQLTAEAGLTAHVKAYGAEFNYSGPIFLFATPVGPRRLRGLFKDKDGNWFVDTELAAESIYPGSQDLREWLVDQVGGGSAQVHELAIVTMSRGEHHASLTTLEEIEFQTELYEVEEMPPSFGWPRGWESLPWMSDPHAVDLVANGVPV